MALANLCTAALRTAIDGCMVVGCDAKLLESNPALSNITGYNATELCNMSITDLEAVETPGEVAAHMEKLMATTSDRFCSRWRRKDGAVIDVEISVAIIQDNIFAFVRDVTKDNKIHSELANSNAELAQFAYVISHDLRQPLRTITNYLTLLQRNLGDNLNTDAKMFMNFALDGAKRMDAMILGLLEYSRVGRHSQVLELVSLDTIIAAAIMNLEAAIADAAAVMDITPKLPCVRGYANELLRLWQNLISNAIQYHAKGVAPQVTIGCYSAGHEQIIWVRDNGIGIASTDYERAFGIFQRLVSRDEYEGTGMGLAICRKIVESHHGRIWLDSLPGQGTTVFVALPKP